MHKVELGTIITWFLAIAGLMYVKLVAAAGAFAL